MLSKSERPWNRLLAPASEPLLTKPTEVSKAIAQLKVGKALGPNGVLNSALRNLHRIAVTFLTTVFNGVLKWQYYTTVWKHAHMISLLKLVKDPVLPSSYRPISLLGIVSSLKRMCFLRSWQRLTVKAFLGRSSSGFVLGST
jgi:hypothetical protein